MEPWKSIPTCSGEMSRGWSQTGSTPCRTRAQDPSLLILSLFTMWPMHTYYGMRVDTFKSVSSLVYIITCLFLIEGKSCPVIDDPWNWAWVHQGFIHRIPRNELSDTIDFQTLVSSWHSLKSSKEGETYFCFVLFLTTTATKNPVKWQNRFSGLYLNVSQQREKKDPFP